MGESDGEDADSPAALAQTRSASDANALATEGQAGGEAEKMSLKIQLAFKQAKASKLAALAAPTE
jgi:hypothetical protein